ncbi:MAG: CPBP family intramembrane glutamic endopeptidase [Verrucomicrobiales bacterium]
MNGDENNQPPVYAEPSAPPPIIHDPASPDDGWQGKSRPRWAWAIHLILFVGYVLGIGLIGASQDGNAEGKNESILPATSSALINVAIGEIVMFSIVVLLALAFSRANWRQMLLSWKNGLKPVLFGAVYSVGLRVAIAILTFLLLLPAFIKDDKDLKSAEDLRPKTENLINPKALQDPVYLALTMTVISFVVAGLREEFWRAGVLAGLRGVAPRLFGSKKGQYIGVILAAIVFGLGHLPQGAGGAIMTGALGIGLGIIMVRHQSIWEAVMAHGFFNATSFALLFMMVKYFPNQMPKGMTGFAWADFWRFFT